MKLINIYEESENADQLAMYRAESYKVRYEGLKHSSVVRQVSDDIHRAIDILKIDQNQRIVY